MTSEKRVSIFVSLLTILVIYSSSFLHDYGYFVDELYYIAGAKRISLGYIDHPPFSEWMLRLLPSFSLWVIRLLPAFCAGLTVFILTDRKELSLSSKYMIMLSMLSSGVLLILFSFYSMNAIEILLITLILISYLDIIDGKDLWIKFWILCGLAVLNKHTSLVYIFSILLSLLFSKSRKMIFLRTFWLGVAISFLIVLPNIIWQIQNNFITLNFYTSATAKKNIETPYFMVVFNQIISQNPGTAILWISGLLATIRSQYRPIAIAYLICLSVLVVSKSSRPDRLASFYPILFMLGAHSIQSNKIRKVILGIVVVGFVVLLPIGLPILSPKKTADYSAFLRIVPVIEKSKLYALPQWFKDRLGWPTFANGIQQRISPNEKTLVIASNYGYAGAIEYFTKIPVVSPHNSYHGWASEYNFSDFDNFLFVGVPLEYIPSDCKPEGFAKISFPYHEDVSIFYCKKPFDLSAIWPKIIRLE